MPRTPGMLKDSRHVLYCYDSCLNQTRKLIPHVDSFKNYYWPGGLAKCKASTYTKHHISIKHGHISMLYVGFQSIITVNLLPAVPYFGHLTNLEAVFHSAPTHLASCPMGTRTPS